MHRLALLAILAACGQPSRPTTSSPSQVASAPTPYSFDFLPADLRERGPSLIDIQCPAGTKRVETSSYGRTHRHCETPTKEYEGPIVEFAEGEIRLRGTHAGYRSGIEISANAGGVIEAEYAANHPVGRYRYRKGSIVVAEGAFDSEGRLDGEWIFRTPVSGQELTRTTFTHGTGSIEIWDWRGSQPKVAARLQCKDGLLDGAQMFHL
ncbi:MAG TPA: hypothetical protein VMZ53_30250, partial [Kofleriaceae bacterium]|nr:hypothetical protein [Kofleriaceae bacterium]